MSVPVVVSASVALVVAAAVRKIRARRRDAAARQISGGRKSLVTKVFGR
jgi:hypothetical protein